MLGKAIILYIIADDKWKGVRTPMTAFFTGGRIKMLSQAMKDAITDFCTSIRADCNFEKSKGFAEVEIDR